MADNPRQVRNLREDIAHANNMLNHARAQLEHDDRGTSTARQLIHWYERREELLARMAEITAQPEETAQ
jgi:hypothetical protein